VLHGVLDVDGHRELRAEPRLLEIEIAAHVP
jgi:hypothetical protein